MSTTSQETDVHRTDVLLDWKTWPYLIVCLSGLQSVGGLTTWGATIIKSLGFTAIRANLLNAPAPIAGCFLGLALGWAVDRYKRFGYAIILAAVWYVLFPYYTAIFLYMSFPEQGDIL